jgi:predicted MPP superfamily phosphohydrolase
VLWILTAAAFCLMVMFANQVLGARHDPFPQWLVAGQFVWHFLVLPVVVLGLFLHLVFRTARKALRRTKPAVETSAAPAAAVHSRRAFLTRAATMAVPVATASLVGAGLAQLGKFRVRSFDLAIAGWPRGLDNYTITVIADVHVGEFSSQKMLDDIVQTSNRLRSDLVLLPGDLINISHADLPGALDMVLRLDARDGVYLIQGNHDVIQGRPDQFDYAVRRRGVNLLVDQAAVITARGVPFQLLGTRWMNPWFRDGSVAYTAGLRQPGLFAMMMAHHPDSWDVAAEHGIPLVFSGHTHGGQIMLTKTIGGGPLRFKYWTGRYDKPGPQGLRPPRSTLIVSNGVGNWFPLRIGAPAEILQITMHPGD